LSASFTLPPRWARAFRASDAQLVFAGRNVAILWKQGHMIAPENDVTSQDNTFATDAAGPPTSWVLRLTLNY
jgi:hypothetical protein